MKTEKYKKNVLDLFSKTDTIEGDIIEVGTHSGDTTEIIAEYLYKNNSNKRYLGLDTFEGYDNNDMEGANKASIQNHVTKRWKISYDIVKNRLIKYKDIVNLYKGDCKVTIPDLIKNGIISQLSFIYIDCNLYQPSLQSIQHLWPYLSKGGIVSIDEHLVGGETIAIKEFANTNNLELKYYSDTAGPSFYIIK